MIYPIILAGGTGSRLWPISTKNKPKQFIPLFSNLSLFQITIKRFDNNNNNKIKFKKPLIVTNKIYKFLIEEQLKEIKINDYEILEEPVCRDTAPAIALSTNYILKSDKNAIILLIPSDHYLPNVDYFFDIIEKGLKNVSNNIILFGIQPTKPETGYGYIKKGNLLNNDCYNVLKFKEKPDKEKAIKYINDGNYYWNSGIYLFTGNNLMNNFKIHCPKIYNQIINLNNNYDGFENIDKISIDYAITEKTKNIIMVKSNIEWSDIGSWDALWNISDKDNDGNCYEGEIISINSSNNLIKTNKKIVSIGLKNLIIVEKEDVILVLNKENCQDLKKISNLF